MSDKWLTCSVSKGMFSDELAVTYLSPTSRETSVFVPMELVKKGKNDRGRVKVKVFTEGRHIWAILPSENQDSVVVRDTDIS